MTSDQIEDFARRWTADWNRHDIEAILAHYAPSAEVVSPVARRIVGKGRVIGIDALRDYWSRGLAMNPSLRFELLETLAGEGCATLLYRNDRGQRVAETVEFGPDGQVVRAFACYAPPR